MPSRESNEQVQYEWYKQNEDDQIWWLSNFDTVGEWVFSFDKQRAFNMFSDYPDMLTPEQKAIFDRENPFWADFFKSRPYNWHKAF